MHKSLAFFTIPFSRYDYEGCRLPSRYTLARERAKNSRNSVEKGSFKGDFCALKIVQNLVSVIYFCFV